MAWEHALLGDVGPARIGEAAAGDGGPVEEYRDLLAGLGRAPRAVNEERLRAKHPELVTVRLPGSGLVVTLGELNVLPDYLGRPEEIEAAPLRFIGPLIQSVRSWSVAELGRSAGRRRTLPRLLPGSMRYPLLGPLAESAEIAAVSVLGKRQGFAPPNWYASVLARNACHFAPFSWYRWHAFHLAARDLIGQSAAARGGEREALRHRALIHAGYADHFLQDSFAAGHQVNKTLVIQWYIEWLAASGVSYPHRDVLDALTVARQPLLHGPGHYLTMLGSGTVQLAVKVAHEYLNKHSLVVSSGPDGQRFRIYGDHTLLASREGALAAAQAAALSRQAIADLLRDGETPVDSWDIFDSFPDHVEQDGRMISLPEWHRGGLRELCFELFGQRSTRAVRFVMSSAFRQLGTPAG
jgi:hypothetical protein